MSRRATSLSRSSLIKDSPANVDSDIAGHPIRKVDDLSFELEAARLQSLDEPCMSALREALKSLWPIGLEVVDGPAPVAAERGWKRQRKHLALALLRRHLHDLHYACGCIGAHLTGLETVEQLKLGFFLLAFLFEYLSQLFFLGFVADRKQIFGLKITFSSLSGMALNAPSTIRPRATSQYDWPEPTPIVPPPPTGAPAAGFTVPPTLLATVEE